MSRLKVIILLKYLTTVILSASVAKIEHQGIKKIQSTTNLKTVVIL